MVAHPALAGGGWLPGGRVGAISRSRGGGRLPVRMNAVQPRPGIASFRPGEVWLDSANQPINAHGGGVLHHEGVYYWFGEHKIGGSAGNFAHVGVRVYTSTDLARWDDAGIALAVSADETSEIARGCIIERPKVIFNAATRRFVMWFHLEPPGHGYLASRSGVAVAEQPTGPYRFFGSLRPNAGVWPANAPAETRRLLDAGERARLDALELPGGPRPWYPKDLLFRRDHATGQMARDMTLFVDDDGVAYHIYASEANGTLHVSQLDETYLRPAGRYIRIFPGRFNEAPAMMKWRGRYFLFASDCTGWAPNPARLLAADAIWGPWEECGNPCLGTGQQIANTFLSQPTFILPVAGRTDAYIYLGDRWRPENALDGRYVWLPIEFHHGFPTIRWHDQWSLAVFETNARR